MANEKFTLLKTKYDEASTYFNQSDFNSLEETTILILNILGIKVDEKIEDIIPKLKTFLNENQLENNEEINLIILRTFYFLAVCNKIYGNNNRTIELAIKGIALAKTFPNKQAEATLNKTLGDFYLYQSDFNTALVYFEKTIELYKSINAFFGVVNAEISIGNLYFMQGEYAKALEIFIRSLNYKEAENKSTGIAALTSNIANIYDRMGETDLSLEYYQRSLILYRQSGKKEGIAINLDNIGNHYFKIQEYDEALIYYQEAFDINVESKNSKGLSYSYFNLSNLYYQKNELSKSYQYIKLGISLIQKSKIISLEIQFNRLLGQLYSTKVFELYNLVEAENYLQHAVQLSISKNLRDELLISYMLLYELYRDSFSWKNALEIYKIYYELEKTIFNEDIKIKVDQFTIERKELELEKNLKEQFAKQLINAQEQERQRIAKDLHDSVGQNILFIKNQLLNNNRNERLLIQSIDHALEEVRTISKDLYPNQLEKYGLQGAVNGLCDQIKASSKIFISSDLQDVDVDLNKNAQINFFRIIQEFVNNTLKHANATSIRIAVEKTTTEIKLIVQDNGIGFDTSILKKKATNSFGLLNMEERIKMLKGTFNIESEIGKGTKSIFTIPI